MTLSATDLLFWYHKNKREMPWRETSDVYPIWLSEVMLQQTQVATVIPYFNRFLKKYPTLEHLADARDQDVLKLWEGLGYYNRCHNFLKAVREICKSHDGQVPDDPEVFSSLSGVGPYTTAAVMSIGYNHALPVIDGNVIRVITRVYTIKDDSTKPTCRKKIKKILEDLIPRNNPADFNQAIMELGALICIPKKPRCKMCPLNMGCASRQEGTMEHFPLKPAKKKVPVYDVVLAVIKKDGKILIQKRPSKGHLAGLWEFPGGKMKAGETRENALNRTVKQELDTGIRVLKKIKTVNHTYSHFKIRLHAYYCGLKQETVTPLMNQDIKWIGFDEIDIYPFPSANHNFFLELRECLKI